MSQPLAQNMRRLECSGWCVPLHPMCMQIGGDALAENSVVAPDNEASAACLTSMMRMMMMMMMKMMMMTTTTTTTTITTAGAATAAVTPAPTPTPTPTTTNTTTTTAATTTTTTTIAVAATSSATSASLQLTLFLRSGYIFELKETNYLKYSHRHIKHLKASLPARSCKAKKQRDEMIEVRLEVLIQGHQAVTDGCAHEACVFGVQVFRASEGRSTS